MNNTISNVVYGGPGSRRPGAAWQRVSTAVWNTLKRIKFDEEESDCEEIFWTPPESPRRICGEGSLKPIGDVAPRAARLLQMHDRVLDQVLWEPTVLPSPSEVRVSKCRWRQTTECFPLGRKLAPQSGDCELNQKP